MFRKILVPADLTDRHEQALNVAAELASRSGGDVILLHVIETIAGVSPEEERDFYARLERASRTHLERLDRRLRERGVRSRAEVRFGHRVQECVRFAEEETVDLVILTAPRFDPAAPAAGLGSLSHRLGLLAPCPVLLVK
jgi:nucleotide-binding universal stress UspA family protein